MRQVTKNAAQNVLAESMRLEELMHRAQEELHLQVSVEWERGIPSCAPPGSLSGPGRRRCPPGWAGRVRGLCPHCGAQGDDGATYRAYHGDPPLTPYTALAGAIRRYFDLEST